MQFFTYALVGCIATLAHYSLLLFCVELLQLPPWLASVYGALLGALVSYVLNRGFTFSGTIKSHKTSFVRFFIVSIFGALSNGVLVWIGTIVFEINYLIAQLIATLITFLTTFKINKYWTFM